MGALPAEGARLPLAALRARLDEGLSAGTWLVHPDGVLGRSLVIAAGDTVAFGLALDGEVTFSGRAMLFPHDWRDRTGAVRATVMVRLRDGGRRELWSRELAAGDRGRPRGHEVRLAVPADTTAVELSVAPLGPDVTVESQVARAIWVEPALFDRHAPPHHPLAAAPAGAGAAAA